MRGRWPSDRACAPSSTPPRSSATRAPGGSPTRAIAPAATSATATTSRATSIPRRLPGGEALCFDPQTSGGLLAAVDPEHGGRTARCRRLVARRRIDRGRAGARAALMAATTRPIPKRPIPKRPIMVSKKTAPTRALEKAMWERGHDLVVGIDEVGRGAWAGPADGRRRGAAQGHPRERCARLEAADRT